MRIPLPRSIYSAISAFADGNGLEDYAGDKGSERFRHPMIFIRRATRFLPQQPCSQILHLSQALLENLGKILSFLSKKKAVFVLMVFREFRATFQVEAAVMALIKDERNQAMELELKQAQYLVAKKRIGGLGDRVKKLGLPHGNEPRTSNP